MGQIEEWVTGWVLIPYGLKEAIEVPLGFIAKAVLGFCDRPHGTPPEMIRWVDAPFLKEFAATRPIPL
jgi:hypothetical protein